jgi:hypothetical protein
VFQFKVVDPVVCLIHYDSILSDSSECQNSQPLSSKSTMGVFIITGLLMHSCQHNSYVLLQVKYMVSINYNVCQSSEFNFHYKNMVISMPLSLIIFFNVKKFKDPMNSAGFTIELG